jgi:hypothetical protein
MILVGLDPELLAVPQVSTEGTLKPENLFGFNSPVDQREATSGLIPGFIFAMGL